jgi:DNA repair exonuclease SbcCD ATPase subunit
MKTCFVSRRRVHPKKLLPAALRVRETPVTSDDRERPAVKAPRGRGAAADVEALERQLAQMNAQLAETDGALAELERQRAELGDAAENIRRAAIDLNRDLMQRREAVAQEEREQAGKALRDALTERDSIAAMLAKKLASILDDIATLDDARSRVAAAEATLRQLGGPQAVRSLPPEPPELAEHWKWLMTRVGAELDAHLADELIDAAALSPLGHAIEDLPGHLREAARHRRRELLKERRPGATDESARQAKKPD